MKQKQLFKLLLLLVVVTSITLACSEEFDSSKNRELYFDITTDYFSPEELLSIESDSLKVTINTNSYWEIAKGNNSEWISITPNKGTGSNIVKLESEENTAVGDREVWVYFNAYNLKDSIKVTQKGRDLALSKSIFENVIDSESKLSLTIESNKEWKAVIAKTLDWLSLNKVAGEKGITELELTVSENKETTVRTDSIMFIAKDNNVGSKVWLKVSQKGFEMPDPSIVIETATLNASSDAGTFELDFISNIDWQISSPLNDVTFSALEGLASESTQKITVSYPENTVTESREIDIILKGKAPNENYDITFNLSQSGVVAPGIIVKNTTIDIDGKNQIFTIELESSNVAWKAVSMDSRFVITENESGVANTTPVLIKVNVSENKTLSMLSGTIEIQKIDETTIKTEVIVNQDLHPMNDETLVYTDPTKTASQLALDKGVSHPTQPNWKFWNAQEFTGNSTGFWNFDTKLSISHAKYNDDMRVLENGTLKLKTRKLATPTTNKYGDSAEYEMAALYSKRHDQGGVKWVKFTTSMRVEVRYRNSGKQGFNEAVWFMGQSNYDSQKIPWPECGEIDLVEAPFKNESHFALHTENFSADAGNAEASSVKIANETNWNIYWVEILEDRVIGGINGHQYFEHVKGDGGNNDWPWDNPAGMMMIITPGIGGWTGVMPNMTAGEEAVMELDWIRVYTNSNFNESSQVGHDGKFY
ncbi:BACON domain-containing protein [Polaribacter sp. IC073]|uniref:BACON domain-containing protein n=1 Tax=Polaribacter sp. IC073 TaxID=2508540 RepID=UPI0011BE0040|nr:BACON domain-containing carbohydrate-binding protein [Polaribacter sp. IC073]TXD46356.1 hypothetical protein ES045_14220 [Polaribacter sp. IC073]